jgi:fumarate reductase (CoM/CoB) subunit B
MAGKWEWLTDQMKGFKGLKQLPIILKFLKGRIKGPDDITKCTLCPNMCRHACPVGIVDGKETTSPSGKSRIGYLLENNQFELTKENIYPLYMCLSCGCCEQYCPFDFSVSDILHPIKEQAIKNNIVFDEFKEILKNLNENGYVYGEPKKQKTEEQSKNKNKGKILYLSGCTFREKYPEILEKTKQIFKNAGYTVTILEDEKCCGIPAYHIGDMELFEKLAMENIKMINNKDFDYIVTSCPSCAFAFRKLYPNQGYEFKPKVLHITEFLKQKEKDFQIKAKEKTSITFHEPCTLINGLEQPQTMNNVLNNIENLEIKTPRRHGENTFCCGYGGSTLCRLNPILSDEISKERINELTELSKNIVTSCPTCKEAFEKNKDENTKVWDIAEFIDQIQK